VTNRTIDIQPELWVSDGPAAVDFYQRAFDATVEHRVDGPGPADVVAQLAVGGAILGLDGLPGTGRFSPREIGETTGRMLLVVEDPDAVLGQAVSAGGTETGPVEEEHGWRLGRVEDPFGHEWEIGRPLGEWPP
jgi:PhnB protein